MDMNEPVKIIEPRSRLGIYASLAEIWQYRELLLMLAWRDYKILYRQTAIGIAWAVLQPILATVAFIFVFGRFKEITDTGIPYALFVFSGLIIWQFFANSVTDASGSLVASSQMISKISFPRIVIPLAKIGTQFINLTSSAVILVVMMIYFQVTPSLLSIAWLIPILAALFIVSASLSVILSAVNVKYRDIQYILPYFIQLGLFVSPVIYSAASLGKYSLLIKFNPLTGIIDSFRAALFGLEFPALSFTFASTIALVLFFLAVYYFTKAEREFSDIL